MESVPPGVSGEGAGGAKKRWKIAKREIAVIASAGAGASVLNESFGTVADWQLASSLRSVGKSSLDTPISTLYASPEKSSSDLFCAFQPKRATVPSLPLLLVWPEMVRPETEKFARPRVPSGCLAPAFAWALARMVASGIASMRPAPNTGVGTRKITFFAFTAPGKSG